MTTPFTPSRASWLDDYIAGRVTVPGQHHLTLEEADAALNNLLVRYGLQEEARWFAVGDKIINTERPHEGVMIVTGYDTTKELVLWQMPNGRNPPITGFGPARSYEKLLV